MTPKGMALVVNAKLRQEDNSTRVKVLEEFSWGFCYEVDFGGHEDEWCVMYAEDGNMYDSEHINRVKEWHKENPEAEEVPLPVVKDGYPSRPLGSWEDLVAYLVNALD